MIIKKVYELLMKKQYLYKKFQIYIVCPRNSIDSDGNNIKLETKHVENWQTVNIYIVSELNLNQWFMTNYLEIT